MQLKTAARVIYHFENGKADLLSSLLLKHKLPPPLRTPGILDRAHTTIRRARKARRMARRMGRIARRGW